MALSTEQGMPLSVAYCAIFRGWALAEQGQSEEGIAQVRKGMEAWRATGAESRWPYFLTLLAEAYGKAGRPEAGLTLLAEALAGYVSYLLMQAKRAMVGPGGELAHG